MKWVSWFESIGLRRPQKNAPRRLCVELLESRTVLSASIGPSHHDRGGMDGGAMIARQSSLFDAGRQTNHAFGDGADHHHDQSPGFRFAGPPRDFSHVDRFNQRQSLGDNDASPIRAPVVAIVVPRFGGNSHNEPQSRSAQPERSPAAAEEFGSSIAANGHSTIRSFEPPGFFIAHAMPQDAEQLRASFDSAMGQTTTTTTTTRLTSPSSLLAIDTAIQEYSASRLMRALSVGDDSDEDDDELLLDRWASSDSEAVSFDTLPSPQLDSGITTALELVSRERKAVDAVLGELHLQASDAEQDRQDSATDPRPATDDIDPPSNESSAGGMVWLVPTGDANASAWNLTQAFLKRTPTAGKVSRGIEVSLGIYQAVDVGETQGLPVTTKVPPTAAPATAQRPAVSTENDRSQQSEQPG